MLDLYARGVTSTSVTNTTSRAEDDITQPKSRAVESRATEIADEGGVSSELDTNSEDASSSLTRASTEEKNVCLKRIWQFSVSIRVTPP
jgi:hypothetical protein